MHTRTRSTLAGSTAATLFVLSVWMFGHPIAPHASSTPAHAGIASALASRSAADTIGERNPSRISMAMPYFSFELLRTRRGIN